VIKLGEALTSKPTTIAKSREASTSKGAREMSMNKGTRTT